MVNSNYRFYISIFIVILPLILFVEVASEPNGRKVLTNANSIYEGSGLIARNVTLSLNSPSDDEDSEIRNVEGVQSSGDGPVNSLTGYSTIHPYPRTRSTYTLLVDIAFESPYKWFMLPRTSMTAHLRSFHEEIIENLKKEFQSMSLNFEFTIISTRPGPLIPKKRSARSDQTNAPSVFATINITEFDTGYLDPAILIHISKCGRQGVLGNLSISEQIVYPEYVCNSRQVFCLPECRNGTYCDGISDCPDTNLDETESCPKCLYKSVQIASNAQVLHEDEELALECTFNKQCDGLKSNIRWFFPKTLKNYEKYFKGKEVVNTLPQHLITGGRYRCSIDGESSSMNISFFKKPITYVSNGEPDADTIIVTEIEGKDVDLWCNATFGNAGWLPVDIGGVQIVNYDGQSSKLAFREITKQMSRTYVCEVQWGAHRTRVIKRTVTIVVVCDTNNQFECKALSLRRSCIPIAQKCDSIKQCIDGSDEIDCNYCSEKELSVSLGQKVLRDVDDTVIMKCLASKSSCKPITWTANGQTLSIDGNIVHFKNSLFIIKMVTDNSGVYRCSDASNKAFIDVSVYVNSGPKLRFLPNEREVNITYGQSSTVTCFAEYSRNVTYRKEIPKWIKDNKALPKGVGMISRGRSITRIEFNRADPTMAGVYQCQVGWGISKRKVVREAIRVNIRPLICKAGEKICVDQTMCLAESFWCDGSAQCHDGSDEKICDKCRNGFIFVQPSSVTVLVGQSIELHCYYDKSCYPVEWRVANSSQSLGPESGIIIDHSKLIIHNAQLTSSNVYECYSGEKRSNSNVTVIRKVELHLSSGYAFVSHGENINIECKSNYGQPQWRRRDLKPLAEISGARQTYPLPNTAKLSIESSSYDARGYYICFVRLSDSSVEAASSLVFVHVYDLKCPEDHLMCDERRKCVPNTKLCDLVKDCKNGEDERNCSKCQLNVRPKDMTITTLGYGVFQCQLSGKDCNQVDWYSKTGLSLTSPRFYKFENSLYVFSPQLTDTGEIACTSGPHSASVFLTVKNLMLTLDPPPSVDSTIYMKKGDSQRISCKSNLGTPQWTFPEEYSVSHLGIKYRNHSNTSAVMYLTNVQIETSQKFVCSVLFSRELKKIFVTVKVS